MTPIALTTEAINTFTTWADGLELKEDTTDLFNMINYFNDDHSAHIELHDATGRPHVYSFDEMDFIYHLD